MAVKKFSFKNVKKEVMPVELPDETTITLIPPTKDMTDELTEFAGEDFDLERAYDLLELILKHNREKKEIARETVEAFDLFDVMAFLEAYYSYMQGVMGQKN